MDWNYKIKNISQNIKLKLTDMSKIIIDLSNFTLREESPTSKHEKKKKTIDYSTVLVESTVIFVPPSN
jgi:hypothetical protein